jgi:hypothetical protein
LKAPNGNSSRLEPLYYTLVRTQEFTEWFGDWHTIAIAKANAYKIAGFYFTMFMGNEQRGLFEIAQSSNVSEASRASCVQKFGQILVDCALKVFPNVTLADQYQPILRGTTDQNGEPNMDSITLYIEEKNKEEKK